MSERYTRRAFLKMTGAAVLAFAAAGALTACGGGGGGSVNPTPAKPEEGSNTKNTTNVGTLEIKNNGGGGPTNDNFSAEKKKYLYLIFSAKNLTNHELTINKTDFSADPTVGVGSAGFLSSVTEGAAALRAEQKIPAGDTAGFVAFFDITGRDLKASSMKITFQYNGKKIVYTVELTDAGKFSGVTVSEVTNA